MLGHVLKLGLRVSLKRAVVFSMRFARHPLLTVRWITFLSEFGEQYRLGLPHDDLVRKSIPTFFLHGASSGARLDLLRDHFDVASEVLSRRSLMALWRGSTLEMGTVSGRSENYRIQLQLADHCGARHEGAFAIRLRRQSDDFALCTVGFVFVRCGDEAYSLAIGGMQGPKGEDAKRSLITATRDLGGLRPKDAALLVLQGLVSEGHAACLYAVSNENHVINRRRLKRRKMMLADLDAYWFDRGGEPAGPFGFSLPLTDGRGVPEGNRREQSKRAFRDVGAWFY
ncbi:hypothetical protein BC374_26040 [Ensifer sp. LC13]|nr:hypothetical protein BBX50_26030 [Ensifer sp. LC11]OCP04546.1 hypothetical protein BC374_26040 [Ensifer sp. LC13]OCP08954.1 hypothetical protein BC362_09370 [Ensifer sp. LC14]OCP30489.1 hypothetical protein BC364_26040 [Ensifer sp. LC499]